LGNAGLELKIKETCGMVQIKQVQSGTGSHQAYLKELAVYMKGNVVGK
jgi:hypothetical protein